MKQNVPLLYMHKTRSPLYVVLLAMGPALECTWDTQTLHWSKLIFPLPAGINIKELLGVRGPHLHFPFYSAWTLSDLLFYCVKNIFALWNFDPCIRYILILSTHYYLLPTPASTHQPVSLLTSTLSSSSSSIISVDHMWMIGEGGYPLRHGQPNSGCISKEKWLSLPQ